MGRIKCWSICQLNRYVSLKRCTIDTCVGVIVRWELLLDSRFARRFFVCTGSEIICFHFNLIHKILFFTPPPPNRHSSSRAERGRLLQFPNKNNVLLLYSTVRNVYYVGRLYGTRRLKNQISNKVEKFCLETSKTIH